MTCPKTLKEARELAEKQNERDGFPDSEGHHWVPLIDAPRGGYVRLKPNGPVWTRENFNLETKAYELGAFADWGRVTCRNGFTLVLVGFTF